MGSCPRHGAVAPVRGPASRGEGRLTRRWSEALEAWDRALALDPSYVDDYNAYEGLELREMVEEARRRASEA